jgi:SNF family Na+-dependent transporter
MGRRKFWRYFGVFGIYTNIAVAAYYCYIESWTLSYVFHSLGQSFDGLSQTQVAQFFDSYVNISESTFGIPYEAVFFYVVCLALNTWILSRGLKGGVEKVAKIGMPMLIIFGVFLAIRALTLGASGAPEGCLDCDSTLGLNFLWEPQYDSLTNFNVWLAAAGQIFFTLSVGMGTIHCYAAYVRSKDDIALNAMSAGWMNGFVEIVLGASVVIPIAVGYLGLDWVKENAGFSMAFQTMPFLFGKWGVALGTLAGVMWFGLLFFAGITSSLAMGTPWMGFMQDEFGFSIKKSALTFGLITLVMGLPTVFFYNQGVFDQYDYWGATVGIVIFALAESILFSWVFGIDKGWDEINAGSDITLPKIYKPIIKYVTPTILLIIFVMSLITPKNNDFAAALENGWELDEGSIIGRAMNMSRPYNRTSFADHYETEIGGLAMVQKEGDHFAVQILDAETQDILAMHVFTEEDQAPLVSNGESVVAGQPIASGSFINDIFYIHLARVMLIGLFVFICALVWRASMNRSHSES